MQKLLKVNQCTARGVKSLFNKKAGKRTLRCYATNQADLEESDIQRQLRMRNIGISAHIDSGKTTLTERVLYYTGRIKEIHEVKGKDNVGATMDSMDLEREKGITIQSAATHCSWKDYQINIIDTPGHVDFTIEVERALRVLDGAILVLCGVSGVQSQTITVDRQMKRYDVPRLMFVNKLDRRGADPYNVTNQVREKLHINASMTQVPIGVEDRHEGVIDVIERIAYYFEGPKGDNIVKKPIPEHLREEVEDVRKVLIERLGDIDDVIAEKFLMEEEPTVEEINAAIRRQTIRRAFVPVFCGSAYKNKGVQLLLDAVLKYLPNPMEVPNFGLNRDQNEEKTELSSSAKSNFVGLAFKLEEGKFGQLTYMRIYQGTMKRGETIFNTANDKKIKVPRLVRMHANQMEDINEVKAGDICAMFGVDCASGDTFTDGKSSYTMESMFVPEPVVSLSVVPKIKTQAANFAKALGRFQREDPTFKVVLDPESNQTLIQGMGELHLEIYVERMKREYDCEVITGKPYVAYREAITKKANFDYLHKKQSGGAGQYARVIGYMEPIPIEDGEEKFVFENHIIGNAISPNYISACEKGFREACVKGGLTEHPVWGVRVVLTDGVTHVVDSSELAFKIASQYAFRQAFDKADPCILEPIMKVEVQAPSEFQGNILGGLNRRRGVICDTITQIDYTQVEAEIPLAEMFGYSNELRSLTQGKGEFSMEYKMHQHVPPHVQEKVVREHKQEKEAKAKSKE